MINLLNFFGNPNIGVFSYTNDQICFIPEKIPKRSISIITETLKASVFKISISGSRIIGILITGNNNGLLLPKIINNKEIIKIREIINELDLKITIETIPSDLNALGNNILINDHAAIINPDYDKYICQIIKDTCLIDEVIQKRIANSKLVGSNALVTNKGLLVNPNASIEELEFLESFFKVYCDIGSVNQGVGLVGSSGIIANSYGAIVGRKTTGPELQRISSVLDL
ncbi:MAG: translation initiation factor IF-6 [Candidatus Helarchaeota archaeon]